MVYVIDNNIVTLLTRCLKLYTLFCDISLKLITLFATNIPLALQVISYLILQVISYLILLKAWLVSYL